MKILFLSLEESAKQNLISILNHSFFKDNFKNVYTFGMSDLNLIYSDLTNFSIKPIMGVTKILTNLPYIFKLRKNIHDIIINNQITHIFFIDSFDFTRFYLKKHKSFKIHYYQIIGPSVFLWNKRKAKFINENINQLFSIFDIERKYYNKNIYSYIGHPLFDRVKVNTQNNFDISNLGFFLGSRDQEIITNMPIIKNLIIKFTKFKNFNFFLFTTPVYYKLLNSEFSNFRNMNIILNDDKYYQTVSKLDFAFACSGTVHLELCFSNIPHIIFYKTNFINYLFFKLFIKIKFISLINIFNKKEIVHEFLQDKFTTDNLYECLQKFINNKKLYINYSQNLKFYLKKSNFKKLNQNLIIDYLKKFS